MIATNPKRAAEVRFPVEGMTCASCVNRIERHLNKLEGVARANVNRATESAAVAYDPVRVGLDDLGRAVEAAGYEARLEQAEGGLARSGCRSAGRVVPARSRRSAVHGQRRQSLAFGSCGSKMA